MNGITPPVALTPQAIARRKRKEAEQRRTFVPLGRGEQLGKFRTQARVFARGRLSPEYGQAVQRVAAEKGRDQRLVRLDKPTLARVEQVAADIRLGRDTPKGPKLIDLFRRRKQRKELAS